MTDQITIPTRDDLNKFLPNKRLIRAFELLFNKVLSELKQGVFFNLLTQVASGIEDPTAVLFTDTQSSSGITTNGNSRISVSKTATYNFEYTIQLKGVI